MRQLVQRAQLLPGRGEATAIYIFGFLFLCGCVIGSIAVTAVGQCPTSEGVLRSALDQMSGSRGFGTLLSAFKYILIITFFSFTVYGAVAVPLTVLAKGFFLSFAVSMFICTYPSGGFAVALSYFLVPEFFSICAVLLIAAPAFSLSGSLLSSAFKIPVFYQAVTPMEKLPRFAFCYFLTLVSFLWEKFLTPQITSAVMARIGI